MQCYACITTKLPLGMKTLHQLLQHCHHRSYNGVAAQVASVEYDSRRVREGSLFVARRGQTMDGHAFIATAIQAGARAIVCEYVDSSVEIPDTVAVVEVKDSALALAELSHAFYDFPTRHLRVIGVTGTNGKTTCTYLLKQFFEAAGEKVGMIGTTGNYIGQEFIESRFTTPEAPELCALFQRMHQAGVTTVAMEVSSHALALGRVHGIHFAAALFTNLTQDHLDFHRTMEEYAAVKRQLFDMLEKDTLAVVNGDSSYAGTMLRSCKAKTLRVGRKEDNNLRIENEELSAYASRFRLAGGSFSQEVSQEYSMALIGSFNIENAALCVACAQALGIAPDTLATLLPSVQGAPGRMKRIILKNEAVAIVDYAHTPDALERALDTAKELLATGARLFSVFGCGGNRDASKRPLMGAISASIADESIITSDNPRSEDPHAIIADIVRGIPTLQRCTVIPDRREAIRYAVQQSRKGDILLVAGKGHEEYQIIGNERLHFSDEEEVLNA